MHKFDDACMHVPYWVCSPLHRQEVVLVGLLQCQALPLQPADALVHRSTQQRSSKLRTPLVSLLLLLAARLLLLYLMEHRCCKHGQCITLEQHIRHTTCQHTKLLAGRPRQASRAECTQNHSPDQPLHAQWQVEHMLAMVLRHGLCQCRQPCISYTT
jgi:hypothetical protein